MNNPELVIKALNEFNVTELVGTAHNAKIINYFKEIGHAWVKDDETAWCSAFINAIAKRVGLEHSGKLDARSWLKIGKEVNTIDEADIVVFWRSSRESWKGHVGIPIREDEDNVYTLGGNQNNCVCIKPYHKGRVLGYRQLPYLGEFK